MSTQLSIINELITKIKNAKFFDRLFLWKTMQSAADEALKKVKELEDFENAALKKIKTPLPDIAVSTPLSTKLDTLREFFRVQVDGYILSDLAIMMAIQPDSQGNAGCTIPPAMTMIATMEMFGTYLSKDPDEAKGTEYLVQFMTDFMPSITERDRASIVYNYRHKLMHVFFAKMDSNNFCGLTKWPASSNLINRTHGHYKMLNVPKLYEIYIQAVESLRTRIFTDKNEQIINAFYNNFPRQMQTTFPSSTLVNTTTIAPKIG
jgi:hypothetical protein